jgi:hypothetical protein
LLGLCCVPIRVSPSARERLPVDYDRSKPAILIDTNRPGGKYGVKNRQIKLAGNAIDRKIDIRRSEVFTQSNNLTSAPERSHNAVGDDTGNTTVNPVDDSP